MRTAKLKLLVAASTAVVGLIGTGALIAVGQEKKPAVGGKPDPEWNKEPEWYKKVELPKEVQDQLKQAEEERARLHPPPPDWGRLRPTAFPDVMPLGPKEVREFAAKRVPQVLESDPPLRKLQKAKLRVAIEEIEYLIEFRNIGDPRMPFESTVSEIAQVARDAAATGVELTDRPEDRRAWLEFRVGVEKEIEAFVVVRVKDGLARPGLAWNARRHRLDAEIALQKHIDQAGGKAK